MATDADPLASRELWVAHTTDPTIIWTKKLLFSKDAFTIEDDILLSNY